MAQKMATPWATNLIHFYLNNLFKTWFVLWHYLALATILATFQKLWVIFSILLVTLVNVMFRIIGKQQ
jgi:hypothetical protein